MASFDGNVSVDQNTRPALAVCLVDRRRTRSLLPRRRTRRCVPQGTDRCRNLRDAPRAVANAGRAPRHLVSDQGVQFQSEYEDWCERRRVRPRYGAVGEHGSIAVIERFIKSMKNECTRLLPIVPLAHAAFGRELDQFVGWYNAERPHSRFGARTPDELYFGSFPACRRPRFEPRERWPRRSPCAQPHALVRGRPGAVLELIVEHRGGRKHLPVVSLRRVA